MLHIVAQYANFALKVTKKKPNRQEMELKKLIIQSLPDALMAMSVGETCISPDDCTPAYVKKTCSELKDKGYMFVTSTKTGVQTITRLK